MGWKGKSILKKRSGGKSFLGLLGVQGHTAPENFENVVFRIG